MSTTINVLPEEPLLQIFSYLEKPMLASCLQVSKRWQGLASDNRLWEPIARQMFNGEVLKAPNIKVFLNELESQKLKSNEELIDRLQAFINRISLGQNARFRCLISTGPKYQAISIVIKGTKDAIARAGNITEFNFKDDCFAFNGFGNRSLVAPQPPEYQLKSYMKELIFTKGPFQGVLRFPELPHSDLEHQTNMEDRITKMVRVKLDKLTNQVRRKNSIMYITAAGVVALSAYLLNLYLTTVNSDQ